ncbi:MAG: hypothetical protein K2L34_03140, partial [Muribaculaceae bacterium]|nr:hypothetical protein [Muribaculaceae bacterium]
MIINKYSIFLFLLLIIVSGCKTERGSNDSKSFPTETDLKADSVNMDVAIKPGYIYWADPYIVVSDDFSNRDRHFCVFDRNLKYLYSFCDKGNGPDECLLPIVVKNAPYGKFYVKDVATKTLHTYDLTDSGAIKGEKFEIKEFQPFEGLFEINSVNDSLVLAKGLAPKRAVRRLINFKQNTVVDSLPQSFDLAKTMGEDYHTEFDDCWVVTNSNEFVCAYSFIDRLEFGEIKDNAIKIRKAIGMDTPPEFHLYTQETLQGKYEYNVLYNILYYEWLFGSQKNVYAGYFGRPWGDIDFHSSQIEKYTYTGEPEGKYNLDIPLGSFIVPNDSIIIGLNPNRSD